MPLRYVVKRTKRFFVYRVLSLDDTPHRIALGLAIGIFVTFTPTIGLQMLLTVLLATLFRANKAVGVPFVWISNPLTIVPVYGPSFLLGSWMLGGRYSWQQFNAVFTKAFQLEGGWIDKTQAWWEAAWPIFPPLWLGSILISLVLGVVAYIVTYRAVLAFRRYRNLHKPALRR